MSDTGMGNAAGSEVVERTEMLTRGPLDALAGVLDVDPPGVVVPLMWHQALLLERPAQATLGPDGHPTAGIPAPPGAGRRRMFAGGRVTQLRELSADHPATRMTRLIGTVDKQGRSGPMRFTTVEHRFVQDGQICLIEEQDIVYRDGGGTLTLPAAQTSPMQGSRLELDVTETLLFRYSALTYNAHRIHYDRAWCEVEGYADLVVHGPLQALLMAQFLRQQGASFLGRRFSYRLLAPMIGPQRMTVSCPQADGGAERVQVLSEAGVRTASGEVDPSGD